MWDRMILPKSLVGAHLTRQLEFVVTGHLGGGQLLGGQACLRRGYGHWALMGSPDAGVRGAFPG